MINIKAEREKNLNEKLEKVIENKVKIEIEISYQKLLDPNEMSAKKPLKLGANGQAISWEEIKRSEHIDVLEEKLSDLNVLIDVIKKLY